MNEYMICELINLMRRPLGGYTLLYLYIYIYIYICLHDHHYVMDFFLSYFMVILRSTTGPYERPMIKVAYGEILFSLYRDYMRDDSSGRVVGVLTCCHPCWTYPGQYQCALNVYYFLGFLTI